MSPARQLLIDFVEAVLRDGVLPSRMSEAPPDEEDEEPPPPGSVQKLVGRRCRQVVEGFDEWRRDHADRSRRLDLLAPLLMSHNISVYRLDFGQNECPPDVLRSISAGYSGYFFVHPHARPSGRKLQRLRKLDPDFGQVLQFVQKHSHAELGASDLLASLESAIAADSAAASASRTQPPCLEASQSPFDVVVLARSSPGVSPRCPSFSALAELQGSGRFEDE